MGHSLSRPATLAGGKFTEPNLTTDKMAEKVLAKMKEMRIPGFLAKGFTKDIPKLKSWAAR